MVHYSPKIRQLVAELRTNLDKAEYLEIEQFQKINMRKLCMSKADKLCEKLSAKGDEVEFKFTVKDIVSL